MKIWRRFWAWWRPSKFMEVDEIRTLGVRLGRDCRIYAGCDFGSEPYLVTLGDHVTLARGVQIITHDGGAWVFRAEQPELEVFGPVRIGNNVFVGTNAILLPGTVIGNNCVIGAGAVVKGAIPDNSVAAGVPARVIKTLAEYRADLLPRAFTIRGKSPAERRRILSAHFGLT